MFEKVPFWRLPIVSGCQVSDFSGDSGVDNTATSGDTGGKAGNTGKSQRFHDSQAWAFESVPDLTYAACISNRIVRYMPDPEPDPAPKLSATDLQILTEIRRQVDNIKTQLIGVVRGWVNAFFIWGPGGHGKSFLIRQALDASWDRVKWHTTDVSAKGLFNILKEFPTHIHVFEDMEKMYKQADCQAILRAACGGQDINERWVMWEKDGSHREDPFQFEGSIVIISNEDPRGGSLKMGAIASRFSPQKWRFSEDELAAIMRDIAIKATCKFGYSPKERLEVAEFVITEMKNRSSKAVVDLRTFSEHAIDAYHTFKTEPGVTHWKEIIRSKIKGAPKRDHAEIERERLMRAACESYFAGANTDERIEQWRNRTDLGKSQFYKYLEAAREEGIYDQYRNR